MEVLGASAVLALVAVGLGVYWFVIPSDAKAKASITLTAVRVQGPLDGTWSVIAGIGTNSASTSWVGYRVGERVAGLHRTDVGRSTAVTGTARVQGATVSAISVVADESKLTTDSAPRDASVRRILDTASHPDAIFISTSPIRVAEIPSAGTIVRLSVTGRLTLHGVTRVVTVPLQARWDGSHIEVAGELQIVLADYSIRIPAIAGLVKADGHGSMEFQLFLGRRP